MRDFDGSSRWELLVCHFLGAADNGKLGLQILDEVLLLLFEKRSSLLNDLHSCWRGAFLDLEIVSALGPAVLGSWPLSSLDVRALGTNVFEWLVIFALVDLRSNPCQNKLHL